jgi:predicted P-loop ATPase/GTPase
MTVYTVTSELKTPWHLKLRRFFRLAKPREVFNLKIQTNVFLPGELLFTGDTHVVVISKTQSNA